VGDFVANEKLIILNEREITLGKDRSDMKIPSIILVMPNSVIL
jgi:hypothetical protein